MTCHRCDNIICHDCRNHMSTVMSSGEMAWFSSCDMILLGYNRSRMLCCNEDHHDQRVFVY